MKKIGKSEQKRQEIVELLGPYIVENGLQAATLRNLAKAANTSDRMLLHYFKDKEELMTVTLTWVSDTFITSLKETNVEPMTAKQILPYLYKLIQIEEFKPFLTLWLELIVQSSKNEEPFLTVSRTICDSYIEWIQDILIVENEEKKQQVAAFIFTTLEGMVFLNTLGYQDKINNAIEGLQSHL